MPVRIKLSNTASRSSFRIARSWLSLCLKSHDCSEALPYLAQQYHDKSWPARLLDVEAFETDDHDLRLVEMTGPSERYTALSYCWGSNAILHASYITTKATLDARRSRISYTHLPKTLQDAVTITRGLLLKYLWIDALCIIQDSQEDWQAEAAKMGTIYSQALVTIAADSSQDCDSGCFNTQSENQLQLPHDAIRVTSTLANGKESTLCFYKEFLREDFEFTHANHISKAPLQTRAWTLQERTLSARILHYGSKQIYWECRRHYGEEEYLRSRWSKDETFPGASISITETPFSQPARNPERQMATRWYKNIIEQYSRRNLTYSRDRFAAISAVARLIQHQIGSEYKAGLWLLNLQYGLYWKCVGPAVRPSEYIAPSFSWAAYENSVQWNEDIQSDMVDAEFTIEGYHIEKAVSDPSGRITSGWLTLTGKALKAIVQPYQMTFVEYKALAYRRGLREEDVVLPNAILVTAKGERCGHAYIDDVTVPEDEVLCLLLRHPLSDSDQLCTLLLSPKLPSTTEYTRKGVGSFPHFPGDWVDRFENSPRMTVTIV